jgi:neutral ceramidase
VRLRSVFDFMRPAICVGLLTFRCASGGAVALPTDADRQQEQGPADAAPSGLLAGVGRADISPPYGAPQLMWGSATHSEGVGFDPSGFYATAAAFSDKHQTFVLASIDASGVEDVWEQAIGTAAKLLGIPPNHIRLFATHTHSAPLFTEDGGPPGVDRSKYRPIIERYNAEVTDKLVGAIRQAVAALHPVHMYGGKGIGTIGINRRVRATDTHGPAVGLNPQGFVDKDLIVYRVDNADGSPYAVLVNFQAHPTVLGGPNVVFSADYPGALRRAMEQEIPGATVLFFQGAAGDQGPVEGFTGDLRVPDRLGRILGAEATAVVLSIDTVVRAPVLDGFVESRALQARQYWYVSGPRPQAIRFEQQTLKLPARTYSAQDISTMNARVQAEEAAVMRFAPSDESRAALQARAGLRRDANLLARWREAGNRAQPPVRFDLSVLAIGDLAFVCMPGEEFAEIGAAVKKRSPFTYTMILGYANTNGGSGAYMPTAPEYSLGGYEVEMTDFGIGSADEVVDSSVSMLKKLH